MFKNLKEQIIYNCAVNVQINTGRITEKQAELFAIEYIKRWQAVECLGDFKYTPYVRKNGDNINVNFSSIDDIIIMNINGVNHLTFKIIGPHKLQFHYEMETSVHESFFIDAHKYCEDFGEIIDRIESKKF